MKNKIFAILALLIVIFLAGCSPGPGKTVQKFFRAVDAGEVEDAMGYLSASSIQSMGYEKLQAGLVDMSYQMAAQGGLKSVNILDQSVNGDIAQVVVEIVLGDGTADTNRMDLIKESGDWKIRVDIWSK